MHQWGLHQHPTRGRLSYLNQLAILQHYGAPTRLIDITFNAWVGVFFAVEEGKENGTPKHEDTDARLFAIDVKDRIINESEEMRSWEDSLDREWSTEKLNENSSVRWTSKAYAWKPPSIDSRIAAQNGAFLLGGAPKTTTGKGERKYQVPKKSGGYWKIEETLDATSVAIRPHDLNATKGQVNSDPCFTFRIKASAKKKIRDKLKSMFGYDHSTIYPDYSGFSSFATPYLRSKP